MSREPRRTIEPKDMKLLWGRSGGMCPIRRKLRRCKNSLIENATPTDPACVTSEMGHIQPVSQPDVRILDRDMTGKERESYVNLILVCNQHAAAIDKQPQYYTNSKLKKMKENHELWVSNWGKRDYDQVIQYRRKFYNLFLYACSIYLAVGFILMFKEMTEGLFLLSYGSLYCFIPFFVYTFDEKELVNRLDKYALVDKRKFRNRLLVLSFFIIILAPVFIGKMWYHIYINQYVFVILGLLGLPFLFLFLIIVFKITKDKYYLIGTLKIKSIE